VGIKEFFSELFSTTKEEIITDLQVELYKRAGQVIKLSEQVEAQKNIIKSLENKHGYYVGFNDNNLESSHIYANRVGFYDDKYVFYLGERVVAILSSEIYKEVIFVEDEKENVNE